MSTEHLSLAARLPDLPQWVETRGMLLSGYAEILGFDSPADFVVRVRHGAQSAISVVGSPGAAAIREAVAGCTEQTPVIAQAADAVRVGEALPDWTGEPAIIHTLPERVATLPEPHSEPIRLLTRHDLSRLGHLPAGLRHELTHAFDLGPIAAVFVEDVPVAFCYPCWRTETLWDVSIDTHEGYRRRGLARAAFRFMYEWMRAGGRKPVWGAMASNEASLKLAARLGFVPIADIVVFSRGHWAFLSGGFAPSG